MRKIVLICAAALLCLPALAETTQKKDTFSSFTGFEASQNFAVTLTEGEKYSATLDIDTRVADYCRMYLQGTTLKFEVVEKDFPKELKAQIRKHGMSSIIENVTITVPEGSQLQNITLSGNATLSCSHAIKTAQDLFVNLGGNSDITSLVVDSPKAVNITAEKNASVNADLSAASIIVTASGNSSLELKLKSDKVDFNCSSNSNIALTGEVKSFKLSGKGNSYVDALNANIADAELILSSSDCDINAVNTLKVTAESGAKLVYSATPAFTIEKIVNSSVTRSTDTANRKH